MSIPNRGRAIVIGLAILAQGCATMPPPRNIQGSEYQPAQRTDSYVAERVCSAAQQPEFLRALHQASPNELAASDSLVGAGDRILLTVSGDRDVITGTYVVAANGKLTVPGMLTVDAEGQSLAAIERALRNRLIALGMVRDLAGNVRLTLAEAAGVGVGVEGAVFEPGQVRSGERSAEARATAIGNPAWGDYNAGRTLSAALRAAGGLRPDADAARIYLVRGQTYATFDLTSALTGGRAIDPQLASGDRIVVPSAGCFQPALVRPSTVTPPGVRVFMSNLTRPAPSNAQSAIGKESTSLPYGSRLIEGMVSANCVGGSAMNAGRSVVLISRNPINGRSVVVSRHVEELVRHADRDDFNPYLMPGDSLACYDSTAMSISDVIGLAGGLIAPALLIKGVD